MENLVTITLSSVVVSSIVTTILFHFFSNKRYIKDKKISVYLRFLDQLHKIIPHENKITASPVSTLDHIAKESAKLEKNLWEIKIVGDAKIIVEADNIFWLFQGVVKRSKNLYPEDENKNSNQHSSEENTQWLRNQIIEVKRARERMLEEMSRDVVGVINIKKSKTILKLLVFGFTLLSLFLVFWISKDDSFEAYEGILDARVSHSSAFISKHDLIIFSLQNQLHIDPDLPYQAYESYFYLQNNRFPTEEELYSSF